MKRLTKISVILLMLIMAGNLSLRAQHGGRGMMRDSIRMDRMALASDTAHRHGMGMVRSGIPHGRMYQGDQFAYRWNPEAMRRGMSQGAWDGQERRAGMNRGHDGELAGYMLESIPNVTEKQKKDIADLRSKNQDEMKKLREDYILKMNALRDSQQKSMMNILTDEQKKFVESKKIRQDVPEVKSK
jgi:hypothetical protein